LPSRNQLHRSYKSWTQNKIVNSAYHKNNSNQNYLDPERGTNLCRPESVFRKSIKPDATTFEGARS